jgi:hypothetical protein
MDIYLKGSELKSLLIGQRRGVALFDVLRFT